MFWQLFLVFCGFSSFLWFLCVCFCARSWADFGFFLVIFLSVRALAAGCHHMVCKSFCFEAFFCILDFLLFLFGFCVCFGPARPWTSSNFVLCRFCVAFFFVCKTLLFCRNFFAFRLFCFFCSVFVFASGPPGRPRVRILFLRFLCCLCVVFFWYTNPFVLRHFFAFRIFCFFSSVFVFAFSPVLCCWLLLVVVGSKSGCKTPQVPGAKVRQRI